MWGFKLIVFYNLAQYDEEFMTINILVCVQTDRYFSQMMEMAMIYLSDFKNDY
jgi:hypothetical protein